MRATSALTSALLVVYGALNGLAAALVLSGVLHAAGRADSAALRRHAGAWHLWFLVWGSSSPWPHRHPTALGINRQSS